MGGEPRSLRIRAEVPSCQAHTSKTPLAKRTPQKLQGADGAERSKSWAQIPKGGTAPRPPVGGVVLVEGPHPPRRWRAGLRSQPLHVEPSGEASAGSLKPRVLSPEAPGELGGRRLGRGLGSALAFPLSALPASCCGQAALCPPHPEGSHVSWGGHPACLLCALSHPSCGRTPQASLRPAQPEGLHVKDSGWSHM